MFGYRIHKTGNQTVYQPCPPYQYETYAPWFEPDFVQQYRSLRPEIMIKEDAAYVLSQCVRNAQHIPGNMVECGVYKGGSAKFIAQIMEQVGSDKKFFLFDTFTGMPATAEKKRDGHTQGDFGDTTLKTVQAYLKVFPHIHIIPGVIPATLRHITDEQFAFVHLDLDLYQSTKDALIFFYDRLSPGGCLISDNYGHVLYEASERRAIDEFFADKPETPLVLRSGQALITKLPTRA